MYAPLITGGEPVGSYWTAVVRHRPRESIHCTTPTVIPPPTALFGNDPVRATSLTHWFCCMCCIICALARFVNPFGEIFLQVIKICHLIDLIQHRKTFNLYVLKHSVRHHTIQQDDLLPIDFRESLDNPNLQLALWRIRILLGHFQPFLHFCDFLQHLRL